MNIRYSSILIYWLLAHSGAIAAESLGENDVLAMVQPSANQDSAQKSAQASSDDLWGEDDWGEDEEQTSPWQFSGFAEVGLGQFTRDNVTNSQQSMSELRGQLDTNYSGDWFTFNGKVDLLVDEVIEETDYDIRELSFAINALDSTDVIIGRQVITWGTGDYLFLNDLFAKDWQSFFAGRDDIYLKAPNDAVRVLHFLGDVTLDFVYSPQFTADKYLTGERFSFFSPFEQTIVAPDNFPVVTTESEQYSLRLETTINGVEYALYGYEGFWTTPVGVLTQAPNSGNSYFPKLNSYGASVRTPAFGGLFNSEIAVYNSIEDSNGSDPFIANDQVRLLLGYERELASDMTGAFQFYIEHTQNYQALKSTAAVPDTLVDEYRQVLTFRLTHLSFQQTLTSSLFVFYSPTDKDAFIRPSVAYRYDDNWKFSSGANIFIGEKDYTFFGQHEDNSNFWLRVRYSY